MEFLLKLSSAFREVGVAADTEALVEMKALTVYDRDVSVTSQVDNAQKATTIFFLLVISLFIFTFVGFMIARRNNRRLPNNGNLGGEERDEQQMLIGNAAEANFGNDHVVIFQQNQFEIEANEAIDHHDQANQHYLSSLEAKCDFGMQLIAFVNFMLEIPSAVLDQFASEDNKTTYVLVVMLLSLTSLLVCLVELVYKGIREKIKWRWSSGGIPWFCYPSLRNRPFGTLIEMIGLSCAIAQCTVTTINYSFYRRDHSAPIKISVWPMIFAFGVLCSKFMAKSNDEDGGESRADQDGADVALSQPNVDQPLTPS